LDQAISYSDESIELSDVLAVTGGVSQGILTDIVKGMYRKNIKETLNSLDELIQNGKDPGRFVYDLIYFLRDVLLYKSDASLEDILERATVDEAFRELAKEVTESWIQEAIMRLNKCKQEIKWTNNPKVFIEIAIITITNRYQQETNTNPVEEETISRLTTKLSHLEKELEKLKKAPTSSRDDTAPKQQPRRQSSRSVKNRYKIPCERIRNVLSEAQKEALKQVQSNCASFLNKLKTMNAPAHATIQDSKPAAASDDTVVVAFKYEIHCSLFLDNQDVIESVLAGVMNKELTIIAIPINDWKELRQEYVKSQEQSIQAKEPKYDPLVEKARELVGDDLIEIHD